MWEQLLQDPVFILAIFVFVLVLAFWAWWERKEKLKRLEERIRKLEEERRSKSTDA
jgi:Tfp pilus assembly protein PilO